MRSFISAKLSIVNILLLCVFSLSADASDSSQKLDWWQTSIIYQIYPRSFKDSNADGIGDLKGIEEQLPYFRDIGVHAIWISPVYKSPMFDMGYDVSNFTDIDPIFGTMDDFDLLSKRAKELDIKIIMDFVPNHSSDEIEWFSKSIKRIDPYTDYYVWRDPKGWINETTPVPPNNWVCAFQGPAWTYNAERKQFYLHNFAHKQPDLNYRSPALVEEMKNIIRFWLDKGVDGFRFDAVPYIYENPAFPDEPIIGNATINGYPEYYTAIAHIHTMNQPDTYKILAEFRKLIDDHSEETGRTIGFITEAHTSLENMLRYYGTKNEPIAHLPFNFLLLRQLNDTSNARAFKDLIFTWLDNMPENAWPNWVIENHDWPRVATKFAPEMMDVMNTLLLLLPGTPFTYQGEEIGMEAMKIRWDQTRDIQGLNVGPKLYASFSRDPLRTPFQWNTSNHAGFSRTKGDTWLPVNPNYYQVNVETQKKDPKSHLNVYKNLVKLRQKDAFQKGDFEMNTLSEWVLAFKRNISAEDTYVIVLNLNNEGEYVHLKTNMSDLPSTMYVVLTSGNSEHEIGDSLNTGNVGFRMRPYSAVVLQATSKRDTPEPSMFTSASGVLSSELLSVKVLACLLVLHRIFVFRFMLR